MHRLLTRILFLAVILLPRWAAAADPYPLVITAEAELATGDIEQARKEAKAAALRAAVLEALRAEVGQGAIDDNALVVRSRFLNAYGDFIVASGVLGEIKSGLRLKVTVGYELNRDKLRARIAALRLQPAERRVKVLLLWAEEERAAKADDALGEGAAAAYRAAAWSEGATAPADVQTVTAALTANGFDMAELDTPGRAWARAELSGREVTKQFLRAAAARTGADDVVFLRIVTRRLAGPPAAHLRFLRVHHVAFVYDAAKGDLAGPPVAVPVVAVDEAGDTPVPDEWINRLLGQLVTEASPGARLVVKGIGSAARFDAVWAALRKMEELGAVVPRQLGAATVTFEFANGVTGGTRAALEAALPGEWSQDDGALSVKLAPAPPPVKKKK